MQIHPSRQIVFYVHSSYSLPLYLSFSLSPTAATQLANGQRILGRVSNSRSRSNLLHGVCVADALKDKLFVAIECFAMRKRSRVCELCRNWTPCEQHCTDGTLFSPPPLFSSALFPTGSLSFAILCGRGLWHSGQR